VGQVDRGHPAASKLTLDAVAIGQGGRQLDHRISQPESPARGSLTMLEPRFCPG
jgi:hypothetical protein